MAQRYRNWCHSRLQNKCSKRRIGFPCDNCNQDSLKKPELTHYETPYYLILDLFFENLHLFNQFKEIRIFFYWFRTEIIIICTIWTQLSSNLSDTRRKALKKRISGSRKSQLHLLKQLISVPLRKHASRNSALFHHLPQSSRT